MQAGGKTIFWGTLIVLFIQLSAWAGTDTTQVVQLNQKAWELKFSRPDSAALLLEESLMRSQKLKFLPGKAEALRIKGVLAHIRGDLDQAFELARQSFEIFSVLNRPRGKASCLNLMGLVYYSKGKYPESHSTYIQVLKIYEQLKDSVNIAIVYSNLGNTYYRQQEDAKALQYYQRSNDLHKKLNNTSGQIDATTNIAMVLMEQQQYQKALENYSKAEKFALEAGNKKLLSNIYQNMATCFRYQQQFTKAKAYYNKSYLLKLELNYTDGICSSLTGLALVSRHTGDPKKAIELGKQALEISQKAGLLARTSNAYEVIYESYADLRDFPNAFAYYQYYTATKDSLMNLEKTRMIEDIQARYETEKKEQQILLLTKEAEVQAAIKNRAILVSILLAMVLVLGGYGYRLKSQNARIRHEKLETENRLGEEENLRLAEELRAETELNRVQTEKHLLEIDLKNRELTSTALFVVQRNEILTSLKEEMKGLITQQPLRESLKPLLKIIDHNMALDNDWENLKLHFDKVHPFFFQSLQTSFPGLTQNELKHIAYMKINLSGKAIAQLLNITVKGIQMSRYRIKKKMTLPEDVNLLDFIREWGIKNLEE
jgi:DNA-binding CsgD family transcriptional regulator